MSKYINITGAPIIIGRFKILPDAKMPAVPWTKAEEQALERLVSARKLRVEEVKQPVKPVVHNAAPAASAAAAATQATAVAAASKEPATAVAAASKESKKA